MAAAMYDADAPPVSGNFSERTELDSHANMTVVGKGAYILSDTGRTAAVNPCNPEYYTMEIPIVDAAILYTDPFHGKDYVLAIGNDLFVESMVNNLLRPFILREAGIKVSVTEDPF